LSPRQWSPESRLGLSREWQKAVYCILGVTLWY
jgi:hypothetical protein